MAVFVTVGTTSFDALISTVTSPSFQSDLLSRDYTSLTIQTGSYTATITPVPGMTLRHYDYSRSIQEDIAAADLVIAHAGAGTALEVLRAGKPLMVVINDELMDNHQTELAEELSRGGHVISASPRSLGEVFRGAEFGKLKPLPPVDPAVFGNFMNAVLAS